MRVSHLRVCTVDHHQSRECFGPRGISHTHHTHHTSINIHKIIGGHPRGGRGQDGAHHAVHDGDGDGVRLGCVVVGRGVGRRASCVCVGVYGVFGVLGVYLSYAFCRYGVLGA